MGRINADLKVYSGIYDFAVDGGAIGTIDLQAPLYPGFCVMMVNALIVTQPSGGLLSVISFGIQGIGTGFLFTPQNITVWASSGAYHTNDPADNFNFIPPVLSNGGNLTMSIFGAPLTDGKIIINCVGVQNPNGF